MTTTVDLTRPGVDVGGLAEAAERVAPCTRRQALVAVVGALAVGTVSVVRGVDAPAHRITRRRGAWTSTGSIAVLGAHREPRSQVHAHGSSEPTSGPVDSSWTTVVTADVELHNGTDGPVLASPGQLRLQVGPDGPTVAPLAAGFAAGPQAAGSTLVTWVSYFAPVGVTGMVLQYAEAGARAPMVLALPALHDHGGTR